VVLGTLATVLAALFTWRFRERPTLAIAGPVIANALIVPAYLPILLKGMGFYTIPFTSISLDDNYLLMYLFGLITTGIGEAVVMYVLGLPLARALSQTTLFKSMGEDR
jgi:high-affinity K+ transport system ATPase subunit B